MGRWIENTIFQSLLLMMCESNVCVLLDQLNEEKYKFSLKVKVTPFMDTFIEILSH